MTRTCATVHIVFKEICTSLTIQQEMLVVLGFIRDGWWDWEMVWCLVPVSGQCNGRLAVRRRHFAYSQRWRRDGLDTGLPRAQRRGGVGRGWPSGPWHCVCGERATALPASDERQQAESCRQLQYSCTGSATVHLHIHVYYFATKSIRWQVGDYPCWS